MPLTKGLMMNVEKQQVEKLRITNIEGLDPINVFIDQVDDMSGRLIFSCYNECWMGFWSGREKIEIKDYLKNSRTASIVRRISPQQDSEQPDWDAYRKTLVGLITEDLGLDDMEETIKTIGMMSDSELQSEYDLSGEGDFSSEQILLDNGVESETLGLMEINAVSVPMMPHVKYEYLCQLVDAIKKAI